MTGHIPHYIVVIHGIGDKCDGFSEWLQGKIKSEFANTVLRISSNKPPEDAIHFCEALWYRVTQEDQDLLWDTVFPLMKTRSISKTELAKSPMSLLRRLKYMTFFRKLVVNFQGDIIAYIGSPGANKYRLIHDKIYQAFEACAKELFAKAATPQSPVLLTVVGHSLGAVIASDILYDALVKRTRWWPPQLRLANMMSLGSPLALYKLRYGSETDSFTKTITMQDQNGRWINFYDPQDIVGYPLRGLNETYQNAVYHDKEISVGQWWNPWHFILRSTPFNHNLYLKDRTVAKAIGWKAALDWLQTNRPDLELMLKSEYEHYDQWVKKTGNWFSSIISGRNMG
ncbi:MAG: hypothetical protein P0119_09835 [Nitrospira sp.]|nr:hypothetical protein [Nitrospira sp.]